MMLQKDYTIIVTENLLNKIGFSVDGINISTIEKLRKQADANEIFYNISNLIKLKLKYNLIYPVISINYLLMRSTIKELPEAIEFWDNMGVNYLETKYLSLNKNIDKTLIIIFLMTEKDKEFGTVHALFYFNYIVLLFF